MMMRCATIPIEYIHVDQAALQVAGRRNSLEYARRILKEKGLIGYKHHQDSLRY